MISNQRNFIQLLNIFLVVAILGVAGLFAGTVLFRQQTEPVAMMSVVWPQQSVTLIDKQTFKVAVGHNYNPEDISVHWSVENWQLSGEMIYDGESFISLVDTNVWDWKRDNTYTVSFTTFDKNKNILASSSLAVKVGNPQMTESEMSVVSTSTSDYGISEFQAAAVVLSNATAVAPAIPFRVEWVAGPIRNNQQFIFHTEGYVGRDLSAFWKAEGGHQNIVYKNADAKVFVTNINVFGWLWKGAGPYPVTFSVTDKSTSAVIASEVLELYWKGTPGASDIEFRSKGAEMQVPAVNSPVVLTSSPTVTTTPVTATSIKPQTPKPVPVVLPKPAGSTTTPTPAPTPTPTPTSVPASLPVVVKSPATSVLGMTKLYTPTKPAVVNALAKLTDQKQKTALSYILSQPSAVWLNGDSYETDAYITGILSKSATDSSVPTFVLYNIVQRDCNSYSSGGAKSMTAYKAWIDRLSGVFKNTGAILIVEPDALAMLNCVSGTARADRLEMIKYAVTTLTKTSSKLLVYIDAGHPFWVNAEEMSTRLTSAGVVSARGFSINVSSYASTQDSLTYGTYLSNLLGGKRYVIDSSRNGNGRAPNGEWCNPSGRALGQSGTLYPNTSGALDAVLWIKFPGESDGNCNGGPGAGTWWTQYATDLYINRK